MLGKASLDTPMQKVCILLLVCGALGGKTFQVLRHRASVFLQAWEEQLNAAKGEAEIYEARAGRALLQVNAIRTGVTELFGAANCEILAAEEVLATGPVGPANLMQYLGIVEQRVDQTLKACCLMSYEQAPKHWQCLLIISASNAFSCSKSFRQHNLHEIITLLLDRLIQAWKLVT